MKRFQYKSITVPNDVASRQVFDLGREGWELVCCTPQFLSGSGVNEYLRGPYLLFKREMPNLEPLTKSTGE